MRPFLMSTMIVIGVLGCGDGSSSGTGGNGGAGGGNSCMVDSTYMPTIDPANFMATVDNPLFPLVPGTVFTYTAGTETIRVEVMPEKKDILGVSCTVVHDVVTDSAQMGQIIEDTFDWYAQDNTGTVWYMGEDTKELVNGMVTSTKGSWEAGVDGAQPGYIIPPSPMIGDKYRQEYYACNAEDEAEVLALDATAMVPAGSYSGCYHTRDTTPLEPALKEEKYYCPNVGPVLVVDTVTLEREELISKTP